jgi:AcrR family transcriptional regulator
MTGLREKSKGRRRQAVLSAAEDLFRKRGYVQTSVEEIARTAQVSIGTLYTYFGSKSGILRELYQPVIEEGRTKGAAVLAEPPARASDAVIALFDAYRFGDNWKGLNLLQGFGITSPERDPQLDSVREAYEIAIKGQLGALLRERALQGRFNSAIDIDEAVDVLHLLMMDTFETYVAAAGGLIYENLLERLHGRVRLVFADWENDRTATSDRGQDTAG